MNDREAVIKGLECMTDINPRRLQEDCRKAGCAYAGTDCEIRLMQDALTLLREQDTVEHALSVLRAHGWQDGGEAVKSQPTGIEPNYNCGKCGLPIQQGYPFCPWCGKAVKWDA